MKTRIKDSHLQAGCRTHYNFGHFVATLSIHVPGIYGPQISMLTVALCCTILLKWCKNLDTDRYPEPVCMYLTCSAHWHACYEAHIFSWKTSWSTRKQPCINCLLCPTSSSSLLFTDASFIGVAAPRTWS